MAALSSFLSPSSSRGSCGAPFRYNQIRLIDCCLTNIWEVSADETFFSQKKYHTKKLLVSLIAFHTEIARQTRELLLIQLFFFEARFEAAASSTGQFSSLKIWARLCRYFWDCGQRVSSAGIWGSTLGYISSVSQVIKRARKIFSVTLLLCDQTQYEPHSDNASSHFDGNFERTSHRRSHLGYNCLLRSVVGKFD